MRSPAVTPPVVSAPIAASAPMGIPSTGAPPVEASPMGSLPAEVSATPFRGAYPSKSSGGVVVAFSADGRVLRAAPDGNTKEYAMQDVLRNSLGEWHQSLESFPGPFGRVDDSTTEAVLQYLEDITTKLESGGSQYCTLEAAAQFPKSAATACRFLHCLVKANGRVQSDAFWQLFAPVLADHAEALRPQGETSALQRFCAKVCQGDVTGAVQDACLAGMWPYAMALSRLLDPGSNGTVLLKFVEAAKPGRAEAAPMSTQDAEDPTVCALLFLFKCVGKGSPPEITEKVLAGWPAYAAVFSLLSRRHDYANLAISFIESLAARLAGKGDVFAGHVCYLMTGERTLDAVDAPSSLVCVLGVEHRSPKNFSRLLDPLALQLSEIFEYALRCGNADSLCPTIQPFKLAHAMLLADMGLTDKARRYMVLLQAFVKAVPQNRLSDAFRSSMREFNEVLNPSLSTGHPFQDAGVGRTFKEPPKRPDRMDGSQEPPKRPDRMDGSQEPPKRPDRMDFTETVESDPLINAGKAVLGFGKSLFSAMKGESAKSETQSQGEAQGGFYFDKEKGRWFQRGLEEQQQADASEYDPMTGKKLLPKVAEPPPPMGGPPTGGPPMGGPPMGGPPMGGPPAGGPPMVGPPPMGSSGGNPFAGAALGRNAGAASLYVNPLGAGAPGALSLAAPDPAVDALVVLGPAVPAVPAVPTVPAVPGPLLDLADAQQMGPSRHRSARLAE
ncbi:unnamed protein product [Effrenium voratum]|nr:unnamed protein product [Effrenium voratum]